MKKTKKEKIINLVTVHIFVLAMLAITWYFIYDHEKRKKHIDYCKQECLPGIVVENMSREKCFCFFPEENVEEKE